MANTNQVQVGHLFRCLRRRPVDARDGGFVSTRPHIVLGGCGRSGTTLARVILDSHPVICCGPESKLFLDEPIKETRLAERYQLEVSAVREAQARSHSRAEFIERFAEHCCNTTGKRRWAEKTPRNVLHLDFVFRHFPAARFVHLLRDGRDVACSLRTHPRHKVVDGKLVALNTWRPMEECATRWRESVLAVRPYLASPLVFTVRYEDLVSRPRETTQALFAFVGEPWDKRVLQHESADSRFRDHTTFPQNPEALRPIEGSALGRWERDMSAEDREIFKRIAGDLLIEFGYAANDSW